MGKIVEDINEIAIIFKRYKEDENSLIEEYVPSKVVEGYHHEESGVFIDSEQNVYVHIASPAEIGNVYGGRRNLYDVIRINPNRNIYKIRELMLEAASKYQYFKIIDEDSNEYNFIKMRDKETGEITLFNDKDSSEFYSLYKELVPVSSDRKAEYKQSDSTGSNESEETETFNTPLELINEIKKTIKGQDEAIETIVSSIWMKYKYPSIPKTNILLLGPTGVGKTAIFQKLKELLDIPLAIYGAAGTSQAGYKGHDIEEMLTQLYYDSGEDIDKAENGIVIVDEFDKLAKRGETGDIATIAVQNELLKLIEGCDREVSIDALRSFNINTSNITFVCCGAFTELFETKKEKVVGFNKYPEVVDVNKLKVTPEMIINYGIIRELVGRLPVIIKMNDINKSHDILKDILLNSNESILTIMVKALEGEGIEVDGLDNIIDSVVDTAIEKNVGARGLFGPTKNIFLKVFYEVDNNPGKYSKVIFGKNIMNDHKDFELVPKKVKTRTKKQELMVIEQES